MSDFEGRTRQWDGLASAVLRKGKKAGVQVEIRFATSDTLTVKVRKKALDELRQTASTVAGLRVFAGTRCVTGSTSHVDEKHLVRLLERLAESVKLVDEDPANGLPDKDLLWDGRKAEELGLFDESLVDFPVETARQMALEAEEAAYGADPRIANSDGGGVSASVRQVRLFNSLGLEAAATTSSVSLWADAVAQDSQGNKFAEGWESAARQLKLLDPPARVGETAGRRAAALIGAGKVPTGKHPVLFAPETAGALVGLVFSSAAGDAVYKGASWLAGREGTAVGSELVSVIDDPRRAQGLSSALFDSEGVATSRLVLVDKGVLRFFPCDSFAARKLGRKSTGHSARGAGGAGAIQSYNLYLENGAKGPEELLAAMGTGLLVTGFIGFGFNLATGDLSRGVRGFWIENGKRVRPVQEVTVAANLGDLLRNVVAVGNDLEFRFGTDSPSLLVKEMSISGS